MNIITQYLTYNRGRQTSDCNNMFESGNAKCFSYSGGLELNKAIQVADPIHIWLSASQAVTIRAQDTQGNVTLVNGVFLYSANLQNIVELSIEASVDDLYIVDPIIELQVMGTNLTVENL